MSESPFVDLQYVLALAAVSRETLMARVKRGEFPPPIDMRTSKRQWRRRDVMAWVEGKWIAPEAAHAACS